MLNNRSFIVCLVVCLAPIGCAEKDRDGSRAEGVTQRDTTSASRFYLEADVLQLETEHALAGDGEAADRIYMHFAADRPKDLETQVFWMRVAAENGNAGYMNLYARTLYRQGDYESCRRAQFWLKRSSEVNPQMSEQNARLSRAIDQDERCQLSR